MATVLPYDELQRRRARKHYWDNRPLVPAPNDDERLLLFETNIIADIPIENPNDARYGQTVSVPMYRTGTLARMIGKSSQTLRQYEKHGVIPPPSLSIVGNERGAERRGYTADQLKVVLELLPLRTFSDARGEEYTIFSRELWRRWAEMPDGVVVEPRGDRDPEAHEPREKKVGDYRIANKNRYRDRSKRRRVAAAATD